MREPENGGEGAEGTGTTEGDSMFDEQTTAPVNGAAQSRSETKGPIGSAVAVGVMVAEIVADVARLCDPGMQERAAELSEIACAALARDLRAAKVRSKDVDKFISAAAKIRREREVARRRHEEQARHQEREPSWKDGLVRDEQGYPKPSLSNLCLMLKHMYAGRLSYDTMAERPCIDGAPMDDIAVTRIRRHLGETAHVNFKQDDVCAAVTLEGLESASFHPARDYLMECRAQWDGRARLSSAATTLLKVPPSDKLACTMFKRTMIAMAARGIDPGCQVDTLLILVGYQGQKKSTLFRVLGGEWFGDSKVDITDRKGQMVMAACWIYEWPEVDRVFAKHSDSDIKAFVSQRDDKFVPMFGRAVKTVKRSWLAVGTTNKRRFLTDATGDRRAWVIDIHRNGKQWKVNARLVASERDQLFGEAVAEYEAFKAAKERGIPDDENPHRWWLNDAEESEREARTADYHVENAWAEMVGRWLAGEPIRCHACKGTGNGFGFTDGSPNACAVCRGTRTVKRGDLPKTSTGRVYVTPALVMEQALAIPPGDHRAKGPIMADTLTGLGWQIGQRTRVPGGGPNKITPYYSPEPNPDADAAEADEEYEREERAGARGEV